MKKSSRIRAIAVHTAVLVLCVSLIAGLAASGEEAWAVTSTASPFGNTKSSYQHNSRFDGDLIVHGVDVSYFQSTASNWKKAKKAGCDYAIMRVTYTTYGSSGNMYIDSKFATHFKKAQAAGVMKGIYVFSQARSTTEARKEAQYAINRLKALGIGPEDVELPVYMDYEFAGSSRGWNRGRLYGIRKKTAIACANAFCDVIRANGYDPGVYACTTFFRNYLGNGRDLASDIDLWCAQYYNLNESGCSYTKWQYTSTARVDGIKYYSTNREGAVDTNFWYLNRQSNPNASLEIYGNTDLVYTGKAVLPVLEIYDGSKKLTEGTDYIVGGINNVKKSSSGAFAYVKGIGTYGGYALVPLTISKNNITHTGFRSVGGTIIKKKSGTSYSIGTDNSGSYVRSVPAGKTVKSLLKEISLKDSYKNKYKLAVINAEGDKVSSDAAVTTGMMIGIYNGSSLAGTADITVTGSTINDRSANYLGKVNRSASAAAAGTETAALSATDESSEAAEETEASDGKLVVDGIGGTGTIKRLQEYLGAKQTGSVKIKKKLQKYAESVKAVKTGSKDTNTVRKMQKWLGIKADGMWGKGTSKALQKKLGIKADGYFGKKSMKALQKYLNNNQ